MRLSYNGYYLAVYSKPRLLISARPSIGKKGSRLILKFQAKVLRHVKIKENTKFSLKLFFLEKQLEDSWLLLF